MPEHGGSAKEICQDNLSNTFSFPPSFFTFLNTKLIFNQSDLSNNNEFFGSAHCGSVVANPTSIHEDAVVFFCLFVLSFVFLGLHLRHMEVPRLGV